MSGGAAGESAESDHPGPDFRPAIIRGLEARFKAVLAACELAEAEARHVVDDEVYVSVGLIRNALRAQSEDHKPGSVSWSGAALMETWVQAALDDPRVGDQFHEMYSYLCGVTSVDAESVSWSDSVGKSGTMTRAEWALHFRYRPDEPKHWLHLHRRGNQVTHPGQPS